MSGKLHCCRCSFWNTSRVEQDQTNAHIITPMQATERPCESCVVCLKVAFWPNKPELRRSDVITPGLSCVAEPRLLQADVRLLGHAECTVTVDSRRPQRVGRVSCLQDPSEIPAPGSVHVRVRVERSFRYP